MRLLLLHHYGIGLNILVRLIFLFSVIIGVMAFEDEKKMDSAGNLILVGIFACIILGVLTSSFIEFIQAVILFLVGIFLVCFIEGLIEAISDERKKKRNKIKDSSVGYHREKAKDSNKIYKEDFQDQYLNDEYLEEEDLEAGYLAYQYLASGNDYEEEYENDGYSEDIIEEYDEEEYNEDDYNEDDIDEYDEEEYNEDDYNEDVIDEYDEEEYNEDDYNEDIIDDYDED